MSDEQQPHETEVGDPVLASRVYGVRIAAGEVQASLDALNQILRSRG